LRQKIAFNGDYTLVLAKHSKNFSLEDSLVIGVDRMQRNFGLLNHDYVYAVEPRQELDFTMKLCALSPFSSSSKSDILDFIGKTAFGLIVLPGAAEQRSSGQYALPSRDSASSPSRRASVCRTQKDREEGPEKEGEERSVFCHAR
jgi:hypothetical protein